MDQANRYQNFKENIPNTERISIIIPTRNAGSEFENLLFMLKNQVGFSDIELVIVDSGSQDNTKQISNRYQAKLIEISSEDFSHAYARNLGAEFASGEYLLFTVQDAIPPSNIWLFKLFEKYKELDVSAISCAEQPRENSDLFYRVICWHHYEFLGVNASDRILSMPDQSSYVDLRVNAQLSNIACLISSQLFHKYKYRFSYAEDLDLGLRLIKDGHKLGFLGSIRIIHSHNRSPYYFLRRGYVDNLYLSDIFQDFHIPDNEFPSTIQDIAFIFDFIYNKLFDFVTGFSFPVDIEEYEYQLMQYLEPASTYEYPHEEYIRQNYHIDFEIHSFIERILNNSSYIKAGKLYDGRLVKALIEFVKITFRYLKQYHDLINKELVEQLKDCFIKEAAVLSGADLAFAYLNSSEDDRNKYSSIDSTLRENV